MNARQRRKLGRWIERTFTPGLRVVERGKPSVVWVVRTRRTFDERASSGFVIVEKAVKPFGWTCGHWSRLYLAKQEPTP